MFARAENLEKNRNQVTTTQRTMGIYIFSKGGQCLCKDTTTEHYCANSFNPNNDILII